MKTFSELQYILQSMKAEITGSRLGFSSSNAQVHIEPGNIYIRIEGDDNWQTNLGYGQKIKQLDYSEYYPNVADLDIACDEAWIAIYAAAPRDQRELEYTMKQLGNLAGIADLMESAVGKMIAERMRKTYEDSKEMLLTYEAQKTQNTANADEPALKFDFGPDDNIPF